MLSTLLLAGCGDAELTTTLVPVTTTTAAVSSTTTTTSPPTSTTAGIDYSSLASEWTVSLRRVGPYLVGMTVEEAEAEGGLALFAQESTDPPCAYYTHDPATGLDQQIEFMVQANRIRRIDVIGEVIKTRSGVGRGSTESEVTSAYGDTVVVSRAGTEVPGHDFVTYVPLDDADADYRLRFETFDNIVTSFWVGEIPNVEWVNRCR